MLGKNNALSSKIFTCFKMHPVNKGGGGGCPHLRPFESATDFNDQPFRESRERKIPKWVWGGAPAENKFGCIFSLAKDSWSSTGGTMTAPLKP